LSTTHEHWWLVARITGSRERNAYLVTDERALFNSRDYYRLALGSFGRGRVLFGGSFVDNQSVDVLVYRAEWSDSNFRFLANTDTVHTCRRRGDCRLSGVSSFRSTK